MFLGTHARPGQFSTDKLTDRNGAVVVLLSVLVIVVVCCCCVLMLLFTGRCRCPSFVLIAILLFVACCLFASIVGNLLLSGGFFSACCWGRVVPSTIFCCFSLLIPFKAVMYPPRWKSGPEPTYYLRPGSLPRSCSCLVRQKTFVSIQK